MTARPDEGTVRAVLALATRAPSIHNSQPWRWRIGDHSIHLFADPSRDLPAADPHRRDLVISCGAVLHHARIAFAAAGWTTVVHRLPNPHDPMHLAAFEFTSSTPTAADTAMARAISLRRSDRRRFSSWPVPAGLFTALADGATRQGAILVPVTDVEHRIRLDTAIADAFQRQSEDPAYAEELAYWSGRASSDEDGVPAANTMSTQVRRGETSMRTFPYGRIPESPSREPDAGELVVIATSSDDWESWLRAGEGLSAALLIAADLRLASCVMSQVLEVAQTRLLVRDRVLDGMAEPQALLRVGWAPISGEPLPETPRRPLDQVIEPVLE